jgi:hypothetical protein
MTKMTNRKLSFDDRLIRAMRTHKHRYGRMPDDEWVKRTNRLLRISKQAEIDLPMTFCLFVATALALIIHQL